ncbi:MULTISPECIES: molybdate ABC transporter substrate-binding protein [unclassified Rhodococcus (in: high G+C Gram-positive bacteria)]|uniref:molybdate ABC transporter substrate-binding protein n=1 Tax=unclassified Rhodococcus (in: high G+C Gram-positive bacteria) TaxID=192944 RepID=UPI0009E75665
MPRTSVLVCGAAALVVAMSACSSPDAGDTVTVFAAASLKTTFTELGTQFEQSHPGTTVTFTFAGSSDLLSQLTQGARGDVFASADAATMQRAVDADLIDGNPVTFATNTLTIVTPPGNPAGITSFADLARPGTDTVVCAPQVPCGAATEKLEGATGVTLTPVSEESSVTDVLGKVTSGQADAGLVYVTDASGAGDAVDTVVFPESSGAVNTYPISTLTDSRTPDLASDFVDFVVGADGQKVLGEASFGAP